MILWNINFNIYTHELLIDMFKRECFVFVKQVSSWVSRLNTYLNKAQVTNDNFDNDNNTTTIRKKRPGLQS